MEKDGPFYILFLDWKKAFDKISHSGLHSALESFGLDPMYLKLIDAIYATPQFTVAAGGQESTTHTAHTGIRQGCPLSPYLFLFVHSTIMNLVDTKVEEKLGYIPWVHSANTPLTQLAYADDTLVVGRNASTVTLILQTIEEVAAQFNLRLNRGKCELIRIHSSEDVHFYSAEGDPPLQSQ